MITTTGNVDLLNHPTGSGASGPSGVNLGSYSNNFQRKYVASVYTTSGDYSVILGGADNRIDFPAKFGVIVGGSGNTALKLGSVVVGGLDNNASNLHSVAVGGSGNNAYSNFSFLGAGKNNDAGAAGSPGSSSYAVCVGGSGNWAADNFTSVVGGLGNTVSESWGFIGGGWNNVVGGILSSVVNGYENRIDTGCGNSFILGGAQNTITGVSLYNFIGGGRYNRVLNGINCGIVGGTGNNIDNGRYNFILGGTDNLVSGIGGAGVLQNNVLLGGDSNRVADTFNVVGGGSSNHISGSFNIIGGGQNNQLSGNYTSALGGLNNIVDNCEHSAIIGGFNNIIKGGSDNAIIIGSDATIIAAVSGIQVGKGSLTRANMIGLGESLHVPIRSGVAGDGVANGDIYYEDRAVKLGSRGNVWTPRGEGSLLKTMFPEASGASVVNITGVAKDPDSVISSLAFDDSSNEFIDYLFYMDRNYASGGLDLKLCYTGAASGTVAWTAGVRSLDGGEDLDTEHSFNFQTFSGIVNSSNALEYSNVSFTHAQADSLRSDEFAVLRLYRAAQSGQDTLSGDSYLIMSRIIENI